MANEEASLQVGTFRSDKEVTLARWRSEQTFGKLTEQFIEAIGKALGQHVVKVTQTHLVSEVDGVVEEQPYEVVAREGATLTIRAYNSVLRRHLLSRIELDEDGYWIYSDDPMKGYCERYKRIE